MNNGNATEYIWFGPAARRGPGELWKSEDTTFGGMEPSSAMFKTSVSQCGNPRRTMQHLDDYQRYGRQMILDGFGLPGAL